MSQFYIKQKQKKKNSTLGPWIEHEHKSSFLRLGQTDNRLQKYHNFLNSIKYTKKNGRQKKKQSVQITQPLQQYIQQKETQQKNKNQQLQISKIYFQSKDKLQKFQKQKLINPTVYFCNYDMSRRIQIKQKKKCNTSREIDNVPRKGSKNLQKLLRIKQKLRVKNSEYIHKVKEASSTLRIRENRDLSLRMQGRKNYKNNSVDSEIRQLLYQTLKQNPYQKNRKKFLLN